MGWQEQFASNFPQAEMHRQYAVGAVTTTYQTIIEQLLAAADTSDRQEPTQQAPGIVARTGHQGAAAHSIDIAADRAMRRYIADKLPAAIWLGEEINQGFDPRVPNQHYVRTDPVDGTTNALTLLDAWSTVALFDVGRKSRPGTIKHLAGAIASASGWVLSWASSSTHAPDDHYARLQGVVYCQSAPAILMQGAQNSEPLQLNAITNGNPRSWAALGTSHQRRMLIADRLGGLLAEEAEVSFYNLGGNNIAVGLLMGQLGVVIEPRSVSLHDSAYLIPYTLLGGHVYDLSTGEPLEYLETYESAAISGEEKPVRPFIATMSVDVAQKICGAWRDSA